MRTARLVINPPAAGSWNMAVDQALLESVSRTGEMVLRFYRWEQPTLSLGYFQSLQDRESHASSRNCPVVRRSTGGGAILHDQELTYSLSIPSQDRWSKSHEQLYWIVHQAIIDSLLVWQIQAQTFQLEKLPGESILIGCGGSLETAAEALIAPSVRESVSSAFLCFQRRSPGDIVWQGYKICGSAQRRRQASILQHGSILFRKSEFAPELKGIDDLAGGTAIDRDDFVAVCREQLAQALGIQLSPAFLSAEEQQLANEIEEVFLSSGWSNKLRKSNPEMVD